MTRRARIVCLLNTLYDLYQPLDTWTGRLQRRQLVERKPAPAGRAECPTCQGKGRRGASACDVCAGRGWLTIDPMTYWDPTTGRPRPREALGDEQTGPLRSMTRGELDAALRRLEEQPPQDPVDLFLHRLEQRDRHGSYLEVERALGDLRLQHPMRHRLVVRVHVLQVVARDGLDEPHQVRLEMGMRFVEGRMPDRMRIPRWLEEGWERERARMQHKALAFGRGPAADRARRERDRLVCDLRDRDVPVDEVCRQVGLSRSQVYDILSRRVREVA